MTTPFDGAGVFGFDFAQQGTPLTAADADGYRAAGVDWIAVKVSDGVTGGGQVVIDQIKTVQDAGVRCIPWAYLYGTLDVAQQLAVAHDAAGGGFNLLIADIEASFPVGQLAGFGPFAGGFAVTTWYDPAQHPGAPSIGQLADIGVTALIPQAYAGAMGVTPAQAVVTAMTDYRALGIAKLPPLLPANDTVAMLAFAQAAKSAGCNGVVGWRHGAPITPASMAGVAAVFAPPAPPPAPTPLKAGTEYVTPKGDILTLS